MEVVPTNDGDDDDGVVWFRCPQCQGFLPKLKGALDTQEEPEETTPTPAEETKEDPLPWDSPAAMMRELKESSDETASADDSSGEPESDDDVLVGMVPENEPEPEVQPVVETVGDSSEPEPAPERTGFPRGGCAGCSRPSCGCLCF